MKTILFCTVGGSPAPIVTAIKTHQPDFVVFICSEDDPITGRPGSLIEVTGDGKVCRSNFKQRSPDLPNIPTQAGLGDDEFDYVLVPADDPEAIITTARERLLKEIAPGVRVVADYTGGTKSMAAGLLLAAVQNEGVVVSLVAGPRTNRHAVEDGTQKVRTISTSRLRDNQLLDAAQRAWHRFAYSEAVHLLEPSHSDDPRIERALLLSRGFAAWDRFEHAEAYKYLNSLGAFLPGQLFAALGVLKIDEDTVIAAIDEEVRAGKDFKEVQHRKLPMLKKNQAAKLWDLYLMSLRRASVGQLDLAVLLLYRTFEGIAQWVLRWEYGVNTGDVHDEFAERFPDSIRRNSWGLATIGSHEAWRLLARLEGPMSVAAQRTESSRLLLLNMRNTSLYAHGFQPVSLDDYARAREFFDHEIAPELVDLLFKNREPSPQLPNVFPAAALQ